MSGTYARRYLENIAQKNRITAKGMDLRKSLSFEFIHVLLPENLLAHLQLSV
jgi:hypothetical protein